MAENAKQFINMCEKAEELQEIFEKKRDELGCVNYILGDKPIWLPSQEQLQEMIKDDLIRLLQNFYIFARQYFQPPVMNKTNIRFTSMHQLWLAYAMKKNYNKIWDNIKWVKED